MRKPGLICISDLTAPVLLRPAIRALLQTQTWADAAGGGSDKFVGIAMDALIDQAGRALAAGDPLGALKRVALRDDASALALRGIAMAQLGYFGRSRALLREAARAFGPRAPLPRARCTVAEAEVALVSRDLAWSARALEAATRVLETQGDRRNAAHARHLAIRHLLLRGRLDEAEDAILALDPAALPAASRAAHELILAGIAIRRLHTGQARTAIERARDLAARSGIAALSAEVETTAGMLEAPAARRIDREGEHPMRLDAVAALLASDTLVVDACRHAARHGATVVSLAARPVLFALARTLAQAWPDEAPRAHLFAQVFGARQSDESHRARLRVEIGRLRALLRDLAEIGATANGFALRPRAAAVAVLAPPLQEEHGPVLALLSDGEAWSSSALALVLGTSQRTVQRALEALAAQGMAQPLGRGRARRWTAAPLAGITTTLLLPVPAVDG